MTTTTEQAVTTPPTGRTATTRGEALAAAIRAALPPDAAKSAGKSIWWQCRKGLYPVAAGGALYGTAYVLHEGHANPLYVLGGTAVIAATGAAVTRIRRWIGKSLWRKNWSAGALALATVWTTTAVQTGAGMDTPMPTVLVVGGGLLAAPWWWFNRPRPAEFVTPKAVEAAPEPKPQIQAGPHPDQVIWDAHLGAKGKPLAGTALIDPEPIKDLVGKPNGTAWTIDGSESKTTVGTMFAALEGVKAAYDRDFVDSLIYLEGSRKGRKTQGRFIVLERNPLENVIEWTEPKLDRGTGILPFSVYPDGSGWARYVMYKPGWGPTHDLLAGGTGSGKSTALKQLAIESLAMGNAVLLFDPHAGAEFGEAVHYFTKTFLTQIHIYLGMHGLEAVLDERMRIIAEVGKANFGPDHGYPIVHAITDEATVPLANSDINRIVARITQEGRKAWMKKTIALQVPSVDNLGDAGGSIREQLASGNTLIYRITQRTTGQMAYQGNLPVEPTDLPEFFDGDESKPTVGLGYVLNGLSRALQSRSLLVRDEMFAKWIPRVPQLDERSEEAFRRGVRVGMEKLAAKNPDSDLAALVGEELMADYASELIASGNVTRLRPRQEEQPAEDTSAAGQVLAFIRSQPGPVRTQDIIAAVNVSAASVGRVLAEMEGRQIEKVGHGQYRARAREGVS